ncbi:MAG: CDP-alcohol phosphatidyltransferase family protein [Actinomycetota bacterium]|nr:CDP-alcohol phosphatidyltransferase family protein [Actinomycetota bacterium]
MLDTKARAVLSPSLDRAGARLAAAGISPNSLTFAGWVVGVTACLAAATGMWPAALLLWLANRLIDGLDGAVARAVGPTDRGGFLDVVADFSIYAGFVLAVAVAVPAARLACLVLLVTYYISGAAFLALSSLLERRRHTCGDERSLRFVGGLAEGTETVLVYVAFTLLPRHAAVIAWLFAAAVAITAVQRITFAYRVLSEPATAPQPTPAGTDTSARKPYSPRSCSCPRPDPGFPAPDVPRSWS